MNGSGIEKLLGAALKGVSDFIVICLRGICLTKSS